MYGFMRNPKFAGLSDLELFNKYRDKLYLSDSNPISSDEYWELHDEYMARGLHKGIRHQRVLLAR